MSEPGNSKIQAVQSEDGSVTFQAPLMHRRGGESTGSQWGDIFVPSVLDADEARWSAEHPGVPTTVPPADLFETESEAMERWNLTADGLRSVFGPPIPAGVVWTEPVWPVGQMEHIYDAYVRPVFKRLHLQPEADVKEFFYSTKEQEAPATEKERQEEKRRREWLESPDGQHWQAREDQRQQVLAAEIERAMTAREESREN